MNSRPVTWLGSTGYWNLSSPMLWNSLLNTVGRLRCRFSSCVTLEAIMLYPKQRLSPFFTMTIQCFREMNWDSSRNVPPWVGGYRATCTTADSMLSNTNGLAFRRMFALRNCTSSPSRSSIWSIWKSLGRTAVWVFVWWCFGRRCALRPCAGSAHRRPATTWARVVPRWGPWGSHRGTLAGRLATQRGWRGVRWVCSDRRGVHVWRPAVSPRGRMRFGYCRLPFVLGATLPAATGTGWWGHPLTLQIERLERYRIQQSSPCGTNLRWRRHTQQIETSSCRVADVLLAGPNSLAQWEVTMSMEGRPLVEAWRRLSAWVDLAAYPSSASAHGPATGRVNTHDFARSTALEDRSILHIRKEKNIFFVF